MVHNLYQTVGVIINLCTLYTFIVGMMGGTMNNGGMSGGNTMMGMGGATMGGMGGANMGASMNTNMGTSNQQGGSIF